MPYFDGVNGHLQVDVVSAASLPLPSGAATSEKQDDAKAVLDTIDAVLDTIDTVLDTIEGRTPAKGQTTKAGSVPVVLASDQSDIPVTITAGSEVIGRVGLSETLDADLDSIDVAKKTKGPVTVAHDAITATATSAEIDCRGYNSLLIHWVSSLTDKTWTIQIQGAMTGGGTFVEWITSVGASNLYTTDISGFFVVQGVPDFIKIVATEIDDGATVSCQVQPFNM